MISGKGWYCGAILFLVPHLTKRCLLRLRRTVAVGLLLCVGIPSTLADSGPDIKNPPPAAVPEAPTVAPLAGDMLLQHEVVNSAGAVVARLEELVLDRDGHARYVVLSHDGLLNQMDYIPVPWQVLWLSDDDPATITLEMTAEELKRAPRIGRMTRQHERATLASVDWHEVDRFYLQMFRARGDSLPALVNQFKLLDGNNDCYIGPHEAALLPNLADEFGRADINNDQRLSQSEFIRFESDATAPQVSR